MAILSTIEAVLPLVLAAGALIGLVISLWFIRFPRLAFFLLFISLITGQVVRYSLPGQGGGLLLSDIAAVTLLLATGVLVLRHYKKDNLKQGTPPSTTVFLLILPFMLWSLIGLCIHFSMIGVSGIVIALAYWFRLSVYLLLLPSLLWLFSQEKRYKNIALNSMVVTVLSIALLGFVQLWLLPDLSVFTELGWDPHQNRLVSTWMDPNLFAGLLMMTLPLVSWFALTKFKQPLWIAFVIGVPVMALLLTQSRSGLIALVGMILLVTPLWLVRWLKTSAKAKSIMMGSLFGIGAIVALMGVLLLGDRAMGLLRNDATVQIRSEALQKVWSMAEQYAVFGTGYNAYQFAALDAGLIGDFTIHSRGGADNSLLTLWVTTVIVGIMLWLVPWIYLVHYNIRRWLETGHYPSLVAIAAFTALLIHSQFVNSFLYVHLLTVLIIIFALAFLPRQLS